MNVVHKSRISPFSCEKLYTLVNDVNHYSEFLPYCTKSFIHYQNADELEATLIISAAGISKSFTTHNHLQHNKMIEIRLVDGPFSHLEGFWRFNEHADGCLIVFDLEFEWSGGLFTRFLSPIFEQITDKMVDAFCDRAQDLYSEN